MTLIRADVLIHPVRIYPRVSAVRFVLVAAEGRAGVVRTAVGETFSHRARQEAGSDNSFLTGAAR